MSIILFENILEGVIYTVYLSVIQLNLGCYTVLRLNSGELSLLVIYNSTQVIVKIANNCFNSLLFQDEVFENFYLPYTLGT